MNVLDTYDETEAIAFMLRKLGIQPHLCGWEYLNDAIFMCIHDKRMLRDITKGLYKTLASKHNTTTSRLERAIRHAIEQAYECAYPGSYILDLFDNVNGAKPCNSLFIATCVSIVTREKHHPIFELGGSKSCV